MDNRFGVPVEAWKRKKRKKKRRRNRILRAINIERRRMQGNRVALRCNERSADGYTSGSSLTLIGFTYKRSSLRVFGMRVESRTIGTPTAEELRGVARAESGEKTRGWDGGEGRGRGGVQAIRFLW